MMDDQPSRHPHIENTTSSRHALRDTRFKMLESLADSPSGGGRLRIFLVRLTPFFSISTYRGES